MPKLPNLEAQVDGPQYLGPATFMKVRMLTEPAELDELRPDVAIVGAPWDDSTTYRPGARFGPRAVRVANYQPRTVAEPIALGRGRTDPPLAEGRVGAQATGTRVR